MRSHYSAKALAFGARGGILNTSIPAAANTLSNAAVTFVSRSRTRKAEPVDRQRSGGSGLRRRHQLGRVYTAPHLTGWEFCGSSVAGDAAGGWGGQGRGVTDPDGVSTQSSGLPRGLILVLAVTGLLVAALALRQFARIAAPVLLALVLVIAVHPLTGILRRRGLPMWLATTITVIAVLGLVVGLAAALALSIARLATILPEYEDNFNELVANLRTGLASLGVGPDEIRDALAQVSLSKVAELAATILAGLAATFSNLLFLLFVIAFMALDAAGFASRLGRA